MQPLSFKRKKSFMSSFKIKETEFYLKVIYSGIHRISIKPGFSKNTSERTNISEFSKASDAFKFSSLRDENLIIPIKGTDEFIKMIESRVISFFEKNLILQFNKLKEYFRYTPEADVYIKTVISVLNKNETLINDIFSIERKICYGNGKNIQDLTFDKKSKISKFIKEIDLAFDFSIPTEDITKEYVEPTLKNKFLRDCCFEQIGNKYQLQLKKSDIQLWTCKATGCKKEAIQIRGSTLKKLGYHFDEKMISFSIKCLKDFYGKS